MDLKAACAALDVQAARIATLEAALAEQAAHMATLAASLKMNRIAAPGSNVVHKASFKTWGAWSLTAVVLVSLPLMARAATLQVTGAGVDGSPSPPMIQFSDATGSLAATLTGSANAITSSTDLVTASGISLTELNSTVASNLNSTRTLLTAVASLQAQLDGPPGSLVLNKVQSGSSVIVTTSVAASSRAIYQVYISANKNVCGSGLYRSHLAGLLMVDGHWTGATFKYGLTWRQQMTAPTCGNACYPGELDYLVAWDANGNARAEASGPSGGSGSEVFLETHIHTDVVRFTLTGIGYGCGSWVSNTGLVNVRIVKVS